MRLLSASLAIVASFSAAQTLPEKMRGVNLGGWLIDEPWMNMPEWLKMGGESCSDCSACAASEWALTKKLGQEQADTVFLKHWETWFSADHANRLLKLGLNHVRIPLGFWIVEEIVDRTTEFYAKGGWAQLKRGMKQLADVGIIAQLDMHALPGVAAQNQMFAGNCTNVTNFYTAENYQRALTWAGVMTAMSHLDPDFSSAYSIEAANEPLSDPSKTPGLQEYYYDFVTIVRTIENALGVSCETDLSSAPSRLLANRSSSNAPIALASTAALLPLYVAKANLSTSGISEVIQELVAAAGTTSVLPVLIQNGVSINGTVGNGSTTSTLSSSHLSGHYRQKRLHDINVPNRRSSGHPVPQHAAGNGTAPAVALKGAQKCLYTAAMVQSWQYQGIGSSLAPGALGPAIYDDHLYYSYGGIAQSNIWSYLQNVCKTGGAEIAKEHGELPYICGEFSLATNWNDTTDAQLRAWSDALRLKFSNSTGWTFWNFRVGDNVTDLYQWSYFGLVDQGIIPQNPDEYFSSHVCNEFLTAWTYPDGATETFNGTLPWNSPPNNAYRQI